MSTVIRLNLAKPEAAQTAPGSQPVLGARHAVLIVDTAGHIVDASDAACILFAKNREALVQLCLADLVDRMEPAVLEFIARSDAPDSQIAADVVCHAKDGRTFAAEAVVQDVTKPREGAPLIGLLFREVTKRAEEPAAGVDTRVARAERLEMAGTLAGQIAHDFNNLLTPLLAYPELIRRETPDNPVVTEYLDIMEKTASDMSRLTQQLLSLSRRGQSGNEVFGLNGVIEQVLALMQTVIPSGIEVGFELAENLLPIKGSKDQLRRVVENLCQNAIDAMGETGRLRIRTDNVYLDAPVGQYSHVNIGEYVKFSVADTGAGIPDAIKEKIFDPFFTTKRSSRRRGSGLGLSIVHGILRDHGGYVDVESAVGRGSTFFVYLPICRQDVPRTAAENLPHGGERILVVDDDGPQVQVLVSLLEVLGYRATGVHSGEEAVRAIGTDPQPFDLVILDMVLEGGMDGLDTYRAIHRIKPSQKVMLISGFTKAARHIAQAQQLGAGAYLRKPLTIERVARVVRQELDGTGKGQNTVAPLKGRRILIVDDEQMIRRLFGMIIQSEFNDAVIDQAQNGGDAIEAFSQGSHDLIIMDLQMPVRDGREAFLEISRLCKEQGRSVPPVIFCTGFSPPESLNSILGDGKFHTLLRKPVRADILLGAIRERLKV